MHKTFLAAVAVLASLATTASPSAADTQKGHCMVVASVHSGKKFALAKCDRASAPGDYIIRSQVWEKDDKKAYNNMARLSGRRFTCDITYETTSRSGMVESTRYKVTNCR
jgi:hypothetical protein